MLSAQKDSSFDHIFWGHPVTSADVRIRAYLFITLFLIGVIYWIGFYNAGNLYLSTEDWSKESAYLDTLRSAQSNTIIPWLWSEPFYHNTTKFLANPEIALTSAILLLRWIQNGTFLILHTALLYSIGFLGSYFLTKKLKVSLVSFCFFWLVFNFNGYLTSHLAIGHFQWTGYFFLPIFFHLLFKFTEANEGRSSLDRKAALGMSLLLGGLFLNGSVHIAIWCSMFLVVVTLFKPSMLLNSIMSIILGAGLGICRLLPAALWFPPKDTIGQGYPTFGTLLEAFVNFRLHKYSGLAEYGVFGWWEYSFSISFMAFIILSFAILFLSQGRNCWANLIFCQLLASLLSCLSAMSIKLSICFPSRFW